ncbi:MAG: PTS glucitol/sorbitol transporter subunit IIC, partial [Selenomonadaceae bacterium]|nr:PTS glucitol/sorbitol transporter subunit IIC [Selenomonadaceae bacterium]
HTMNGLFPHVDPAELFVFLGVANGISALGLPTVDLALRYFLIGIVINFLRGWITDFMTAYVQKQQGVKLSKELAPTKS